MNNSIPKNDTLPDLGDNLERAVMQLIWEHGPSTAEIIRGRLSRPLKESTVRTVLKKLEEKGYLNHRVDHRTFVYQAIKRPGQVAAGAVKRIIDRICNGSIEDVLVGMVDAEILDPTQLQDLAAKIAKAREGKT
jgi:predicted transcriptional regulator